ELSRCWQRPVDGLQVSSVQPFRSLQSFCGPGLHEPSEQASFSVHGFPSSHGAELLPWVHPACGSQLSSVQGSLSLQLSFGPPTQLPPEQVSLVVQALPSSHGAVLFACVQPLAALQESVVHTLLSLQSGGGPPAQLPPAQWSPVVHALPSSQGSLLFTCVQPLAGLHASSGQPLPSLPLRGAPSTQVPLELWSLVVPALPSLQGSVFTLRSRSVAGLQESSVHTLLSLQLGGGPPTQPPPAQASLVVQALPSSQGAVLLVFT